MKLYRDSSKQVNPRLAAGNNFILLPSLLEKLMAATPLVLLSLTLINGSN